MTERSIEVSRTINVPRRFVFEAWTEERHISRWLGPDHFTVTTHRFAFRTREQRDELVEHYGAIEGGRQTLEHLDRYAARLATGATGDA